MPTIHPTAIVDRECDLADDVEIGPWCRLEGKVILHRRVRLLSHVVVQGPATIGEDSTLYPFVTVGQPPQDFKFKPGAPTAGVVIGSACVIREQSSIHSASNDHTPTRVGSNVYMMVNAHVGHDADVGNNVVMVNNTALGGHAKVGDLVTIGGGAMVHQHCRVGRLAFLAGFTANTCDVPPFCTTIDRSRLVGINVVGLRRSGMPRDHITRVRTAYRLAFAVAVTRARMLEILDELADGCPPVAEMADFVRTAKKPVAIGRQARHAGLHAGAESGMISDH